MGVKMNQEEMSRVLGEFDCGHLVKTGRIAQGTAFERPKLDLEQAAFNLFYPSQNPLGYWWDKHHKDFEAPEQLLAALEEEGFA